MKKFIFKSVEHGDTVYVDRLDYRALVNRFLLLQEVAEAAAALQKHTSENKVTDSTVVRQLKRELDTAIAALQQQDGVS
jgi:hypothetical protein